MKNSVALLFEETVKRFPNKIAVKDALREITFEELREESMKMAMSLIESNGEGFSPIVVYLNESVDSIVCFLASIYSGNIYVPIAYNTPIKRLENILADLPNPRIISDENGIKKLEDILQDDDVSLLKYDSLFDKEIDEKAIFSILDKVIDTDPLYIIFTSGSTGVPKGVTISHRGVMDYAYWLKETFDFTENTILGNQASFYFDNSVFDIYSMVLNGATMLIIPKPLLRFPDKLLDYLIDEKVTTIFWVPTMMISLASAGVLEGRDVPDLKNVVFAGEVMPNKHLNVWRKNLPNVKYANLYGPTEITVDCTYYIVDREFDDADPLPIGKACRNTRIYLLDDEGNEVKKGEMGLIHVAGISLALGYWNKAEKTSEVFIKNPNNPFYYERLYNTGDLAYMDEDENLIFVGRKDSQIKHRGNRIELGEIENAAQSLPYINNAIAMHDVKKDDIVLILETKEELKLRKLNMELKKIIPAYMCPTRIECMEKLPKTANEKIDRLSLKKEFIEN